MPATPFWSLDFHNGSAKILALQLHNFPHSESIGVHDLEVMHLRFWNRCDARTLASSLRDVKPGAIRVDNDPAYINSKLLNWAAKAGISIPTSSLNSHSRTPALRNTRTVRHEWLDQYIFESVEAQGSRHARTFHLHNGRPIMCICGVTPAQKLKIAA